MQCSGCGKDIPFTGDVCPFCLRDKSKDQARTALMYFLGMTFGFVGYQLSGIGWGFIGMISGMVLGLLMCGFGKSSPPEIHLVSKESPAEDASIEARLRRLDDLRSSGLISQSEYAAARRSILAEL